MNDEHPKKLPGMLIDYRLEQLALGELSAGEHEQLVKDLRSQGQNPDKITAKLHASNAGILAQYPPQMMAARIQDRLQKTAKSRAKKPHTVAATFAATALAVALLAVFVLPTNSPTNSPTDMPADSPTESQTNPPSFAQNTAPEGIRYKGMKPILQVWRQTPTGAEQLEKNALATAGDIIQLRFQAADAQHGVIASIDGRGHTTLHFPDFEDGDTTLAPGLSTLNHSYQLDDAPEFERFFFITAATPIDSTTVLDTLEQFAELPDAGNAPLILSEDLSWTDFLVTK